MKRLLLLLAAFALAGLSLPAFADNINYDTISGAATRSTDLSRQLLIMVYGDVVNNPLQPQNVSFIGQLYGVFNAIIAGLAFIWFMGITLRATVLTGNRGKVFGRGNTMMAPVSSLAGFMALVPTPSGWSISNLAFLWMASIMGVGSANLLTDKAADTIMDGQSMIMQPVSGETISAARGIFDMYLCKAAMNTEQAEMHQSGSSNTPPMSEQRTSDGREIRISNGSALCGSAKLPEKTDNSSWFSFNVPINSGPLENAQMNAFTAMNSTLSQSAENFVSAWRSYQDGGQGRLPDAEAEIQQAARQYEDTITAAAASVDNEGTIRSELANYLKKNGWISLGAWYQSFATANQKVNNVANQSPIVTGSSNIGEVGVGQLQEEIRTALLAQRKNSTYTPPLGSANVPGNDSIDDGQSANSTLLKALDNAYGVRFANFIIHSVMDGDDPNNSSQVNPLLKMKSVGDYTLGAAQSTFAAFTVAKGLVDGGNGSGLGKIVNAVSGAGYFAKSIIGSIAPIVYFILFIMLSIGFSLSIFLPFIPLIYWITACTSWLGSVLIGTTAGSLWAATHIGTEEDKGSRANYGYIFLIDAAIRPSLMVFGFFFASLVVVAIGTLLNILILPAMANVQADSITGLASIIGILMIYARTCTTLVSSAFSLQVYLPDYVIAWLGGREAAQMMKGAVESTRNMFAGFGSKASHAPGIKRMDQNKSVGNSDGFK
ncbi:conjugal transfer/type IV secretion protein DotA/TraY [Serratia fonticola]|uniref:Conjugal transfer/type IV secretion protein DotA/TraY n=1 Tax=Serratia fonticola TaxID=47917 RepID=A0A559SGW7_SERFO|nr:DotA/TraY family protein [Serratia fonticola]TQI77299.1 conjugal transfer/type IV secretion protein DotA/TraY [Serratia fonticola]TQI93575.1 conjugal transfer/type IV secretion protein DotA/TraY [Serratia fonticola]TVZ61605.1 conjugal transfer/type IV secretion protein DotA/TraY [Serratia fonticola]